MTTTVTITQVPVTPTPTTWASASYAWNSSSATYTWATATEPLTFSAAIGETLSSFDSAGNLYLKSLSEVLATAESYADVASFNPNFSEDLTFGESLSNVSQFIRSLAETLSTADTYGDISVFSRNLGESLSFLEGNANSTSHYEFESFSVGGSDRTWEGANYSGVDSGDDTWVNQGLSVYMVKPLQETLGTSGLFDRVAAFNPTLFETLSTDDSIFFGTSTLYYGTIGVAETPSISVGYIRGFFETLTALSSEQNNYSLSSSEVLSVGESLAKLLETAVSEGVSFSDLATNLASYSRVISEALSVSEVTSKSYGANRYETCTLSDLLRRCAQAVISDIAIKNTELTPSDFANLLDASSPAGYSSFSPFIEGDWEYKSAIMKAEITAGTDSRLRMSTLTMNVDVPDVHDSGTVTVTSSGMYVTFSRSFYEKPEISISLRGGAVFCTPRVESVDLLGFFIRLYDSSGSPVAGTVSWKALGY